MKRVERIIYIFAGICYLALSYVLATKINEAHSLNVWLFLIIGMTITTTMYILLGSEPDRVCVVDLFLIAIIDLILIIAICGIIIEYSTKETLLMYLMLVVITTLGCVLVGLPIVDYARHK